MSSMFVFVLGVSFVCSLVPRLGRHVESVPHLVYIDVLLSPWAYCCSVIAVDVSLDVRSRLWRMHPFSGFAL
jgi:hypothetical protein